MITSPSALFDRLGASLKNVQWSWGALRSDGAVFLRVWQDETKGVDGKRFVRLLNHQAYQQDPGNLGYKERLSHIQALAEGAPGYAVFCRAKDIAVRPREIVSFERRDLIRLGEIRLIDGDEWAEMVERVPVDQVCLKGMLSG